MKTFLSLLIAHLVFVTPLWAQTPATQPSDEYVVVALDLKRPQMVPFIRDITLLSAVTPSGDYNEYANLRFVCLVRSGKKQRIDIKSLRQDPSKDLKLEPWDIIYLPESIF